VCEWARGFPGEVTGARRGQFLMGLSALFASRRTISTKKNHSCKIDAKVYFQFFTK